MSQVERAPVIGLEVHCQLKTASKLFSACPSGAGGPANSRTDAYTWGLPGALPVVNREAVRLALRLALALGCEVAEVSRWERKHYFYPDLPKGYQITQQSSPLARGGGLEVPDPESGPWDSRTIPLARLHLEEDAGKVQHLAEGGALVDYNRAGAALVEVVTEPAIRSPAEAARVLRALRAVVRALGVSDATMEAGGLRCDVNVSLREVGSGAPGARCEIKNLSSFKFIEQAVAAEVARQQRVLAGGGVVESVTLGFDEGRGRLQVMRMKELATDYRYLPEPDLPPLLIDAAWIEAERAYLPELPERARRRYRALGLAPVEAALLAEDLALGRFYDAAYALLGRPTPGCARRLYAWLTVELLGRLHADGCELASSPLGPRALAELVEMLEAGELTGPAAKDVFARACTEREMPRAIAARDGLGALRDDGVIAGAVAAVLARHPQQVAQLLAGREALRVFLMGQVLKDTRGRADPARVRHHLDAALRAAKQGVDRS